VRFDIGHADLIQNRVKRSQIPRAARGTSGDLENGFSREQNQHRPASQTVVATQKTGRFVEGRLCFCPQETI
jgi:hypothetical protein